MEAALLYIVRLAWAMVSGITLGLIMLIGTYGLWFGIPEMRNWVHQKLPERWRTDNAMGNVRFILEIVSWIAAGAWVYACSKIFDMLS